MDAPAAGLLVSNAGGAFVADAWSRMAQRRRRRHLRAVAATIALGQLGVPWRPRVAVRLNGGSHAGDHALLGEDLSESGRRIQGVRGGCAVDLFATGHLRLALATGSWHVPN